MFHSAFPRYFGKIRKIEACTADNFSTPIERKIERNFTAHNSSLIIAWATTLKWKFTWKQGSWNYVIRELYFIMNLRKSHMVLPLLSLLSSVHIFFFFFCFRFSSVICVPFPRSKLSVNLSVVYFRLLSVPFLLSFLNVWSALFGFYFQPGNLIGKWISLIVDNIQKFLLNFIGALIFSHWNLINWLWISILLSFVETANCRQ